MAKIPSDDPKLAGFKKEIKNERQIRFCEEYILDLNASQAAIRAGYAEKTAGSQASRLLKNVNIQNLIDYLKSDRSERTQITADKVLQGIAELAFSDIRKVFTKGGHILPIVDLDDLTAAAIQGVEVVTRPNGQVDEEGNPEVDHVHKFRLADKSKAFEMLGRHLKLFTDKVEHGGRVVVKDLRGVQRG